MSNARDKANIPALNFSSKGIDDNATSTAITIDSGENVGIGTDFSDTSIENKKGLLNIHTTNTGTHNGVSLFWNHNNLTTSIEQRIQFALGDDASADNYQNAGYIAIGKENQWGGNSTRSSYLSFATTNAATQSEAMRIDSSGNVLINTTSAATTTAGIKLRATDNAIAAVVTSNPSGYFGRLSSDGDIVKFRKDSTTVGTIGIESAGFYIDGEALHTGLIFNSSSVSPRDNGSATNNATDLGNSAGRWKDLYLGGGLVIGGTGTANKLDDYEEGNWTPTLTYSGGQTATLSENGGVYTKIGRMVTVHMEVDVSNTNSGSGSVIIGGLPFTVGNLLSPTGNEASGTVGYYSGFSTAVNSLIIDAQQSSTNLNLRGQTSATATSASAITASIMSTGEIRASITYFTD